MLDVIETRCNDRRGLQCKLERASDTDASSRKVHDMAKGQEKKKKDNKPKLSIAEKKKKKAEKAAAKS